MNSRALLELFDVSASRSKDFDIRISTSVLEIYNEEVRDLLSGSQASLSVRTTSDGVSPVDGLTITSVGDMKEVQAVLARGQVGARLSLPLFLRGAVSAGRRLREFQAADAVGHATRSQTGRHLLQT